MKTLNILLGFKSEKTAHGIEQSLAALGYSANYTMRPTKSMIEAYLKEHPELDVLILKEFLDGGERYGSEELVRLADDSNVHIVVVLQSRYRGRESMWDLYGAGILDVIFNDSKTGVPTEKLASLAVKGRTRRQAREYYRISRRELSRKHLGYDEYLELCRYLQNPEEGINAGDRLVHLSRWLSPERLAVLLEKLPEDLYGELSVYQEYYEIHNQLVRIGLLRERIPVPKDAIKALDQAIETAGEVKGLKYRKMDEPVPAAGAIIADGNGRVGVYIPASEYTDMPGDPVAVPSADAFADSKEAETFDESASDSTVYDIQTDTKEAPQPKAEQRKRRALFWKKEDPFGDGGVSLNAKAIPLPEIEPLGTEKEEETKPVSDDLENKVIFAQVQDTIRSIDGRNDAARENAEAVMEVLDLPVIEDTPEAVNGDTPEAASGSSYDGTGRQLFLPGFDLLGAGTDEQTGRMDGNVSGQGIAEETSAIPAGPAEEIANEASLPVEEEPPGHTLFGNAAEYGEGIDSEVQSILSRSDAAAVIEDPVAEIMSLQTGDVPEEDSSGRPTDYEHLSVEELMEMFGTKNNTRL